MLRFYKWKKIVQAILIIKILLYSGYYATAGWVFLNKDGDDDSFFKLSQLYVVEGEGVFQ